MKYTDKNSNKFFGFFFKEVIADSTARQKHAAKALLFMARSELLLFHCGSPKQKIMLEILFFYYDF